MAKKIVLLDGLSDGEGSSVALFYKQGSSDKEYHVSLEPSGEGWVVNFLYGKRGSALKSGTKTASPVSWEDAAGTYSKVVSGQLKDGYTKDGSGAAYKGESLGEAFSGISPMLLNPMDEEEFEAILADDDWMLQEKFDGERLMILKDEKGTRGINRRGLFVAMPSEIVDAIDALPAKSLLMDAEWLGVRCAPFDLMELDGKPIGQMGTEERKAVLDELLSGVPQGHLKTFVRIVDALGTKGKRELHDKVKAGGGEGVVGKLRSAPYQGGRPASGGPQIKRKFFEEATLIVGNCHASKRSVEVFGLSEKGEMVSLGRVTIPPNQEIPKNGDLVDVRYLYAYRDGGLHVPTYKGPRTDLEVGSAVLSQLKYKREDNGGVTGHSTASEALPTKSKTMKP